MFQIKKNFWSANWAFCINFFRFASHQSCRCLGCHWDSIYIVEWRRIMCKLGNYAISTNFTEAYNSWKLSFTCRWIWSTCTRSLATTLSPWASTSQSSTSASSETLFQKLQRAERKMWCHWISPQHWVGLWVAGCKISIGRFLFSFFSKQVGYTFSRWDILDVPATKNVELYNPEMDESKPKSEVPSKYFFGLFIAHIWYHGGILSTFCYFETLWALGRHFLVLIHLIAGGRRKRQVVDGHHLHLDNATEDAFLHGKPHMNLIIYLPEEKSEFMTTW